MNELSSFELTRVQKRPRLDTLSITPLRSLKVHWKQKRPRTHPRVIITIVVCYNHCQKQGHQRTLWEKTLSGSNVGVFIDKMTLKFMCTVSDLLFNLPNVFSITVEFKVSLLGELLVDNRPQNPVVVTVGIFTSASWILKWLETSTGARD